MDQSRHTGILSSPSYRIVEHEGDFLENDLKTVIPSLPDRSIGPW